MRATLHKKKKKKIRLDSGCNPAFFVPVLRFRIEEAAFLSPLSYGDVIYRHALLTLHTSILSNTHSLRCITDGPHGTHHCVSYQEVGGLGQPALPLFRSAGSALISIHLYKTSTSNTTALSVVTPALETLYS